MDNVSTDIIGLTAFGIGIGVGISFGASLFRQAPKKRTLQYITTSEASAAAGHYSQAILKGHELFISGLLPIRPSGEKLHGLPFEQQVEAVLDNLCAILTAAGTNTDNLISTRVYMTEVANWETFNKLYAARLGNHRPARCVVPVTKLHYGLQIELEAIAIVQ